MDSKLSQHFQAIHAEGQGVWTLTLFSRTELPDLVEAAFAGNSTAFSYLRAISTALDTFHATRSPKQATLCLLCDAPFWRKASPDGFVFFHAARDDPSHAMASGLCQSCFRNPELQTAVLEKFRQVMPDLRVITPSQPGHA